MLALPVFGALATSAVRMNRKHYQTVGRSFDFLQLLRVCFDSKHHLPAYFTAH